MRAILEDPQETPHRRAPVMIALAEGPPLKTLELPLRAIFLGDAEFGHTDRRLAYRALANIMGRSPGTYRALFDALAGQTSITSAELRIELLALLMPAASSAEIRETLEAYGHPSRGVMGYARPLARPLRAKAPSA